MNGDAIGMMEGAYFVSRSSLLTWLNAFLKTDFEKVEQMCTGAAHLQVLDALFPGEVPLHKVNFSANPSLDYECLANYKLIQEVFTRKKLGRVIPVDKLVKGRYQDNLEFLQWMKSYFDKNWNEGQEYDAVSRREEAQRQYTALRNKKRSAPLKGVGNTAGLAATLPVKSPTRGAAGAMDTSWGIRKKDPGLTCASPRPCRVPRSPLGPKDFKAAPPVKLEGAERSSKGLPVPPVVQQAPAKAEEREEPSSKRACPPATDPHAGRLEQLQRDLAQARFDAHVQTRQAMLYYGKLKDITNAIKDMEAGADPRAAMDRVKAVLFADVSPYSDQPAAPAGAAADSLAPIDMDME